MRTARWLTVGVCGLAAMGLLTGCGPNPKDLQIDSLNQKVGELERENQGLRQNLAQAIRERDDARRRADALAAQNAQLQGLLAQKPASELPTGWKERGEWTWIDVGTDFLFDSGKATLKSGARERLAQVVNDIRQIESKRGEQMVCVIGHTDSDPILRTKNLWQDNLDLSANRGMTVYRELERLGVNPTQMIAGGQGEHNPAASNASKPGKAENRRVQIAVVPPYNASAAPTEEGAPPPTEPGTPPVESGTPPLSEK